jgi:hypothetical protein
VADSEPQITLRLGVRNGVGATGVCKRLCQKKVRKTNLQVKPCRPAAQLKHMDRTLKIKLFVTFAVTLAGGLAAGFTLGVELMASYVRELSK